MTLDWIIQAKINSQTNFASELLSLIKMMASAFIIYFPLSGWLAKGLYSPGTLVSWFGVVICGLGILLMIWSRHRLGKNWSGKVMIQQQHSLIKDGPYGIVRHPQYTGFLVTLLGTALVLGQWFSFIWFALLALSLIAKSQQEEKILTRTFGGEYLDYRKRVKMLIPFVL